MLAYLKPLLRDRSPWRFRRFRAWLLQVILTSKKAPEAWRSE
jgi:hypothetical protein